MTARGQTASSPSEVKEEEEIESERKNSEGYDNKGR